MLSFIQSGGAFMYVILGLSVVALAIILEKFYLLNFSYRHRTGYFKKVVDLVRYGDYRTAMNFCHSTAHPLGQILSVILKNPKRSKEAHESALNLVAKKILPKIQKRTVYLQMIGNVATLVGLLGTIQGLILSFSSLSGANAAAKGELLAKGISTAMNTTAFGLMVAIPCIVAFSIFSNKENAIIGKYEETVGEVLHTLCYEKKDSKREAA